MNILFLDWECFGKVDAIFTLEHEMKNNITYLFHKDYQEYESADFDSYFDCIVSDKNFDFCFSFNFYPILSDNCLRYHIKYIAYVYDSPFSLLYSTAINNSNNYIFLFDKTQYYELCKLNIHTVYYLPLPVNAEIIDYLDTKEFDKERLSADISFVGALYDESHNFYDLLGQGNEYLKGYLDAVMNAQLLIQGYQFIEEVLTDDIIKELKRVSPYISNPKSFITDKYIYSNYFIDRKLTQIERKNLLTEIGKHYPVKLFTINPDVSLPGVQNMGVADYYSEMPYIFAHSKINLNITLRSIKSGIPLRAMDIMGAGGFLLTNYQEDFLDYFIPDEDFVYFTDKYDLLKKIDYYLTHDEERKQIAQNGHLKVKQNHSFLNCFNSIFKISNLV